MSAERGGIGTGLAVFVVVVLLAFGACLAIADDNEDTGSLGAPPAELVAGGGNHDCGGDRSCHPGSDDCAHAEGTCSDDDFKVDSIVICVQPESCRFD